MIPAQPEQERHVDIRRAAATDTGFVRNAVCQMTWDLLADDRKRSTTRRRVFEAAALDVEMLLAHGDTEVLVAETRNGDPVGCLVMGERQHIFTGQHEGFIHYVYVDPDWRRMGIAKELLVRAETIAADRGYVHLNLETVVHNEPMRTLVRSLNYEEEYVGFRRRIVEDESI